MREGLIEKVKVVIIVVLFITTILLLYLLWSPGGQGIGFSGFIGRRSGSSDAPAGADLIRAEYAVKSLGSGSFEHSLDTEEVLAAAREELAGFLSQSYAESSAISEEQYELAMRDWPSVSLGFGCGIPVNGLFSLIAPDSALLRSADQIADTIAFSEAAPDSVFARDSGSGLCYRYVFGEARDSVEKLLSAFGDEASPCYPARDLLGVGSAYLPLGTQSSLSEIPFYSESGGIGNDAARAVFGDTFSFVRRITDSFGNITFMYGYGVKNLYLYADGSLEYRTTESGSEATDFARDLDTALSFAAECGGLKGDEWKTLRLVGYRESGTRVKTRSFSFAQSVLGVPVYCQSGTALSVTVTGGSVTGLRRELADPGTYKAAAEAPAASPANVIANNSNHIYNILKGSVLAPASDEAFDFAARAVRSLAPGYYADRSRKVLVPAWVLKASGGELFYFDLYEGTPLGYTR